MAQVYHLAPNKFNTNFIDKAAQISSEICSKHSADVDENGRFPSEAISALADQGFMGLCVPTEFGGQGEAPRTFAAVVEELAKNCGSTAMIYVMHVTAGQAIATSSNFVKKKSVLEAMAQGEHLTTLAFSEKGSRSQFWMPSSQLENHGEDFSTNADKSWVTSASQADSYVSSARMPGAGNPMESTLYYMEPEDNGVTINGGFNGLGLRGNDSAPVHFSSLSIAKDSLLTENGKGADAMLQVVLPWFVVGTSAMAHGLCLGAVQATAAHLSSAGFDSGSKLRDLPNLRARLAQMSMKTERSRSLLGQTVAMMEAPTEETPLYVLQSRLSALETAVEVTDLAMKACGGAAFSKHLGVERLFRDARAGWVMAPTVDHLNDFVGRALTGLPLF